jgi:hypothetical protein
LVGDRITLDTEGREATQRLVEAGSAELASEGMAAQRAGHLEVQQRGGVQLLGRQHICQLGIEPVTDERVDVTWTS